MTRRIFASILFVLAAVICLSLLSSPAYAQKGTKMKRSTVPASTSTKSSSDAKGGDSNVKIGERVNSETKEPASSSTKSGAKGAAMCAVIFDNYTNWYIKVFVDGDYEGMVGRMGEKTVYAIAGGTAIYARADFDDGSYRYWGPRTFNCAAGNSYRWDLK